MTKPTITQNNYHEFTNYKFNALKTGFSHLDRDHAIGSDDFTVIAGATGSGKSTVALHAASNISVSGKKTLYYNLELSSSRVMQILGSFRHKLDEVMKNLVIINERPLNLMAIKNAVLANKAEAIFIDVFSCLLSKTRGCDIPRITEDLATQFSYFPERYGCAVFVTEQLNKDRIMYRRPSENDIKGGAALCHKASKIIIVYRHLKEHIEKSIQQDLPQIVTLTNELIIRKDRFGRSKNNMQFYKFGYGFQELTTSEWQEYHKFVFVGGK